MSKFIDILTRSSQTAAQPIGFRTSKAAQPRHWIQLVVAVTKGTTDTVTDYVTGADAGLLRISKIGSSASTLKKTIPTTPDIPWGVWLEETAQEELKKAMKSGCDFIVLPAGATLVMPPDDNVGIIIQIDTSVAEGPLRTLNELPVDAVLVTLQAEKGNHLTWHQLMLLQRFGDIVAKPLLVSIPPGTGTDELQLLWEAGVDGLVIDAIAEQPPGEATRLRQMIDNLKPPTPRKQQKMDALLPHTDTDAETMTETEEEDDED
jgi:hypothetical protein